MPAELAEAVEAARQELVEAVAEEDDEVAELFLAEAEVPPAALGAAIARTVKALRFVPVFMGSAFKNKGVQTLLDGVVDYLPSPLEVANTALDLARDEAPVELAGDPKAPLVALAFKLEEGRFGQLTYLRVYEGTVRKGDTIVNSSTGRKLKVPRLVRMHSDELEDIPSAAAGEIVALFGVECASGDTFTHGLPLAMTSMKVPDPVMSLAVAPTSKDGAAGFSKALQRFQTEGRCKLLLWPKEGQNEKGRRRPGGGHRAELGRTRASSRWGPTTPLPPQPQTHHITKRRRGGANGAERRGRRALGGEWKLKKVVIVQARFPFALQPRAVPSALVEKKKGSRWVCACHAPHGHPRRRRCLAAAGGRRCGRPLLTPPSPARRRRRSPSSSWT